jgi:HSP20 family protein
MVTKNLAPWDWFKRHDFNIPSFFKNNTIRTEDNDKNIDRIFDHFIKDFGGFENFLPTLLRSNFKDNINILPRIDLSDSKNEYVIEADLPGVKESDVSVSVSKDKVLSIKGKRESKEEHKDRNYYRMERSYGSFEREIALPEVCDYNKVNASFHDGVLSIRIPKVKSSNGEVKEIKINHIK